MTMNEAARICARLIASGAIPRSEAPELDHPAIREDVETRLHQCGFVLASSPYSDHYGVRLANDIDAGVMDGPSNLGLGANACALLTVLWAKLVLQKRTAAETQHTPDAQQELLAGDRREQVREFEPSVRFETLDREFGRKLGGRTRLLSLLGQLRRLKFVTYRRLDAIRAGPLLELAIDGEKMIGFIRSRVLSQYLGTVEGTLSAPHIEGTHLRVLKSLSEASQPPTISELEGRTGIARRDLKKVLRELREEQEVEVVGSGAKTAYRLRSREA